MLLSSWNLLYPATVPLEVGPLEATCLQGWDVSPRCCCASNKHGSIDDSRYAPCNKSDIPRAAGSDNPGARMITKSPVDDSRYVPCNQSDSLRECHPYLLRQVFVVDGFFFRGQDEHP
jgi:hypothetical protein